MRHWMIHIELKYERLGTTYEIIERRGMILVIYLFVIRINLSIHKSIYDVEGILTTSRGTIVTCMLVILFGLCNSFISNRDINNILTGYTANGMESNSLMSSYFGVIGLIACTVFVDLLGRKVIDDILIYSLSIS